MFVMDKKKRAVQSGALDAIFAKMAKKRKEGWWIAY